MVESLDKTQFSFSGGYFSPVYQKLLMSYYKNHPVVMCVVRGGQLARLDPIFIFRRLFYPRLPEIVDVLLQKPSCGHEGGKGWSTR